MYMSGHSADKVFAGSIPEVYDTYLVPLIFESYAADLARRVAARRPARVLEIATGTGVVTRAMATALSSSVTIVATDLNRPMLDRASAVGTFRPIEWRQADAMELPFGHGSFDVVVCQFGAMFFPDKPRAFAQARRVLVAGGALLFNVGIESRRTSSRPRSPRPLSFCFRKTHHVSWPGRPMAISRWK
jgi:ubiquinone/menaquinone biosynthesis C-methylase UbiE